MTEPEQLKRVLSYGELRTVRSWLDLNSWTERVLDVARATDENKAFIRLSSGPAKVFREEVLPVRDLARHLGVSDDARFKFPADDGKGDAFLTDPALRLLDQCIEVVNAVEGHSERLRMELLTNTGSAPSLGQIRKVGRNKKANYSIEASHMGVSLDAIVMQQGQLVHDAIVKKREKDYLPGTWLLAQFDDVMFVFNDDELLRAQYDQVEASAEKAARGCSFGRVYVVGGRSKDFCALVWEQGSNLG